MSDTELKVCPFCGGAARNAEVEQIEHSGWVGRIECEDCDAVLSLQYSANSPGIAGAEVIAAWNRRPLPDDVASGSVKVDAVRANFTPFYIMSNVRRITPVHYNKQRANWVLAMDVFAVGSRSAWQICLDAGIDPDGFTIERAAIAAAARGDA
ncbi:Lar family restriction alleviation protein [Cupriavidus metallidurans]|uniref:Lar family restriction alleviation protein n=1 Tax=Cupriavidus metallidurans TaxID=119219 RepID=UPI00055D3CD9|nr:Lar family restriction alleviation protein [Cupriavidus metallidurans]MDE4918330.1 Lar family restriction alleviation protein [Cupriavidus metallidurans]